MASPSSSLRSPPPHSPVFTPIPEHEQEEEDEAHQQQQQSPPYQHRPTPLHSSAAAAAAKKLTASDEPDHVVSCYKCRPSAREKISVVPLDTTTRGGGAATFAAKNHHRSSSASLLSPIHSNILRSLFSSITKKSPRPSFSSSSPAAAAPSSSEISSEENDQWKIAAAELSQKLVASTRKRDEAILEASRLKYSMSELEKKLNRLEIYCHDLKSALDLCNNSNNNNNNNSNSNSNHHRPDAAGIFPLDDFLSAISDARAAVRRLSRSLSAQIRQPHDIRLAAGRSSSNPKSLLFYLEALVNRAFYEDFESAGFDRGGPDRILDPRARAEANRAAYVALRGLTWDEVLSRGTRHYSEGFSRFCDRKMSEVVGSVLGGGGGGGGGWPEPLLQAFFGAAKWVWLVHLLAGTAQPAVPVFRVEKGARFDGVYMEDVAGDRVRTLSPAAVRMMVAPGFYVGGDSVVKCKVLCVYHNNNSAKDSGVGFDGMISCRASD